MKPVFHLIPSLEIGGIETMMTRFVDRCPSDIPYVLVIFDGIERVGITLTDAMLQRIIPLGAARPLRRIVSMVRFIMDQRNAVIVSSTWKMAAMVLLARLFGWRGTHWSFTHRSSSAGPIDQILRRWQVRHSDLCLTDSAAAAAWVRRQGVAVRIEELLPIFTPPEAMPRRGIRLPARICFVGRLAPVKNLPSIFKLIETLTSAGLAIEFDIYGPDGGQLALVEEWLGRPHSPQVRCQYLGAVPPDRTWDIVRDYDFLISCSHTEGFALSVAEAMQMGVVPIVGTVGGPATYCDDANAILLRDYSPAGIECAARQIRDVVSDPPRYARMSAAAQATFSTGSDFVRRFSALLRDTLEVPESGTKAAAA